MTVSEWLANINSHAVYELAVFNDFPGAALRVRRGAKVELVFEDGRKLELATYDVGQVKRQMATDPRGGEWWGTDDEAMLTVTGHVLASQLARFLTGSSPGDLKMGRGSGFRDNVAHIKAWEEQQKVTVE
jgi:hypothetical protein